jgi:hypothetical protein
MNDTMTLAERADALEHQMMRELDAIIVKSRPGRSSPRQARRRAAGPVAAPLCGFQAGQKGGLNFLARPLAALPSELDRQHREGGKRHF